MQLEIRKSIDFEVTGKGDAPAWEATGWHDLKPTGKVASPYRTRFKILWSEKGVYFLFDCEDRILKNTFYQDFANLWEEDVIEVFLWPYQEETLYFEYEISPLGYELPILVPNHQGRFKGWLPWDYEGGRRIRKATSVTGDEKAPGAHVEGWRAEFFIPFELFYGLGNVPPKPGTEWRANMYRIDFDNRESGERYVWAPVEGDNFHDYMSFGRIQFAE